MCVCLTRDALPSFQRIGARSGARDKAPNRRLLRGRVLHWPTVYVEFRNSGSPPFTWPCLSLSLARGRRDVRANQTGDEFHRRLKRHRTQKSSETPHVTSYCLLGNLFFFYRKSSMRCERTEKNTHHVIYLFQRAAVFPGPLMRLPPYIRRTPTDYGMQLHNKSQ